MKESFHHFKLEEDSKISGGGEKNIYQHPDSPDKVIARWHAGKAIEQSPRQVRGRYYLTKILYMLFPKNVADINLIYKNNDKLEAVLEKKDVDDDHKRLHEIMWKFVKLRDSKSGREKEISAAEDELWREFNMYNDRVGTDRRYHDFLERVGRLRVRIDGNTINFGYDKDGNLLYLDSSFGPWSEDVYTPNYDEKRLRESVNTLPENERELALAYLKRLEDLREEELRELESKRGRQNKE